MAGAQIKLPFLYFHITLLLLAYTNTALAQLTWGEHSFVGKGRSLHQDGNIVPPQSVDATTAQSCPLYSPVNESWVPASRIFDQLSFEEINEVKEFLIDVLALFDEYTPNNSGRDPQPTDNFLYRIELMPPPKTEALAFLDEGGPQPERYARAIVFRGAADPRDIMEYKVGPLPIRATSAIQALRRPGEIPFYKHPAAPAAMGWGEYAVGTAAFELRQLFRNMTGGKCYTNEPGAAAEQAEAYAQPTTPSAGAASNLTQVEECTNQDMTWLEYPDFHDSSPARISVIKWQFQPGKRNGEEAYLHTLPISWKLNETDPDLTAWRAFDFEYCHQGPFETAADLLKAFEAGELKFCEAPKWGSPGYNFSWALTDEVPPPAPHARPGPRQIAPGGLRFTVSPDEGTGRRFRWFGWEGHITIRADTGLALNDITYKGRRIVYELAQQEMYVVYSGYGGAGQTVYFDSFYGIGLNSRPMKRGHDCPHHAYYMDTVLQYSSGPYKQKDLLCIYEEDTATTAWRHTHVTDAKGSHADSARAIDLVVRTVSTIGNYDYIFEIRFRQDASVEVRCHAAGYMSALFFDPGGSTFRDLPFGTRVQEYVLANIHDHLSGWKVDMDIDGRNNSFLLSTMRSGTYQEALASIDPNASGPGWWSNLPLKYLHREEVTQEAGFALDYQLPQKFRVANELSTNKWGYPRAYAIVPGATTSQLLPDTHPLTKAAAWTKYHVAVTQHKDNEYRSHAAMYDMYNPGDPIVSLDHYIDGESVQNADLVNWVMVGLQHVPRAEDVPLIYNMYVNFFLKPWNYFDSLEALDAGADDPSPSSNCKPQINQDMEYTWTL